MTGSTHAFTEECFWWEHVGVSVLLASSALWLTHLRGRQDVQRCAQLGLLGLCGKVAGVSGWVRKYELCSLNIYQLILLSLCCFPPCHDWISSFSKGRCVPGLSLFPITALCKSLPGRGWYGNTEPEGGKRLEWGWGLEVVRGADSVATVPVQRALQRAGVHCTFLSCTRESQLSITIKPVFFP